MNVRNMPILIILSLSFIILTLGYKTPIVPASPLNRLTTDFLSCTRTLDLVLAQQNKIIEQQTDILARRFKTLDQMTWLPKAPQLRGRFDQEPTTNLSQARIGLRWHMPKFFEVQNVIKNNQISPSSLVKLWNNAQKLSVKIITSKRHLEYRVSWVKWAHLRAIQLIKIAKFKLIQDLVSLGLKPKQELSLLEREINTLKRKLKLQQRKLHTLWNKIGLLHTPLPPLHLSSSPLRNSCITFPQNPKAWKTLLNSNSRTSSSEIEVLIDLYLIALKSGMNSHQWLDFLEISYDGTVGSERFIAEIGMNLPLGSYQAKELHLQALAKKQSLQLLNIQSKNQREQLKATLSMESDISIDPLSETLPDYNKIKNLHDLDLSIPHVNLWQAQWLDRLSIESLLIDWESLTQATDYP